MQDGDLFQQPDPKAEQLYELSRMFGDNWTDRFIPKDEMRRLVREMVRDDRHWADD